VSLSGAESIAGILKALSNEVRLRILFVLRDQKHMRFSDLAEKLDITPEKLAFHLKQLSKAGLIHSSNEYYCLTHLGEKVLANIDELLVKSKEPEYRSVLLENGIVIPLETYMEYLLENVCRPGIKRDTKRKVLLDTYALLDEKLGSTLVPENIVKLFLLEKCMTSNCLRENIDIHLLIGNEESFPGNSVDTNLLAEVGLLEPLASGIALFDVNWVTGIQAIYLPISSTESLRKLVKLSKKVRGVIVRLDDNVNSDSMRILEVLASITKLTLSITLSGEPSRVLIELLRLGQLPPNNFLVSVYVNNHDSVCQEDLKNITRLINLGVPLVFTFEDKVLAGDFFLVPNMDIPLALAGSISILLPTLYRSKDTNIDPLDILLDVYRSSARLFENLQRRGAGVVRLIGEVLKDTPSYAFQFSYPGYEPTLLQSQPAYIESWGTPSYLERLLVSARGFIEEVTKLSKEYSQDTLNVYFSPNKNIHIVARAWRTMYPEYVNNFSPFIYSDNLKRSIANNLRLEGELHASRGLVSVPEIVVKSITPADLYLALKQLYRVGLRGFTVTRANLYMCLNCGEVSQVKTSQCPRCYSNNMEELKRLILYYDPQKTLHEASINALASRPSPRKIEEIFAEAGFTSS
jgi:DNA-binding transcriptional ArsR family regulator/predicted Zn-ribbon and HTH transcriptional regulator